MMWGCQEACRNPDENCNSAGEKKIQTSCSVWKDPKTKIESALYTCIKGSTSGLTKSCEVGRNVRRKLEQKIKDRNAMKNSKKSKRIR